MTISADIVGIEVGPMLQEVDARWLMAYAAGIGWLKDGVMAHPVFPVCYEWPLALAIRDRAIPPEARLKAVHATHDLVIHRLPVSGDRLSTTARVEAVERRKPGAYVVTRFETRDASGAPVTTTEAGALYLGVETTGSDCHPAAPRPHVQPANAPAPWKVEVPVPRGAAHVYTECSRIWNPIHTDRAVARAAGLPDIILHGTATLAMAVSAVIESEAGGDPTRVKGIRCGFGAMVLMPSTLIVEGGRAASPEGDMVSFRVLTDSGAPAIRDSVVLLESL
ncbi:MAG: MaoC family dehydratase N-terminal domain-containing protein [Candidatus Rokubacteria bacterium]|nr:MaoC family dehydratase N-terminal domain-containing protein [Candidatus Rokubacteria bacterium]